MNKKRVFNCAFLSAMIICLTISCDDNNFQEILLTVKNELNIPITEVRIERLVKDDISSWGDTSTIFYSYTGIAAGDTVAFSFSLYPDQSNAYMILETLVLVTNKQEYWNYLSKMEAGYGSNMKAGQSINAILTKSGEIKFQ